MFRLSGTNVLTLDVRKYIELNILLLIEILTNWENAKVCQNSLLTLSACTCRVEYMKSDSTVSRKKEFVAKQASR